MSEPQFREFSHILNSGLSFGTGWKCLTEEQQSQLKQFEQEMKDVAIPQTIEDYKRRQRLAYQARKRTML